MTTDDPASPSVGGRTSPQSMAAQLTDSVRRHWGCSGEIEVVPIDAGLNNPTFRVDAGGRCLAARLYRNLDLSGIEREHALLAAVASAGLSFAVPAPFSCRDGGTLAETEHGRLALFAWISGEHADPGDPQHLFAMGAALAELDEGFLRLDATLSRLPGKPAPRHGELHLVHPAVGDPSVLAEQLAARAELGGLSEQIGWLGAAIAECMAAVPRLYATLPQQWIHQDLARSNVLQVGGRVTGVLDFEFSDRDLRALDLVAALANSVAGLGEEAGWRQAGSLCRGYCSRVHLTGAEIEAVPDLLRLRCVVANIHGAGRWLAGLNATEEVIRRLRYGAAWDRVIQHDADRLRALVRSVAE